MNGSLYSERVVQDGNSNNTTPEQNGDVMERSDTIVVIIVIMLVSLCFFCILWRCSSW
jgi:hypothetical protein